MNETNGMKVSKTWNFLDTIKLVLTILIGLATTAKGLGMVCEGTSKLRNKLNNPNDHIKKSLESDNGALNNIADAINNLAMKL